MSDRIIVATFSDTKEAYGAAKAIKNLDGAGAADFKLKAAVVVKKDGLGDVKVLANHDRPPLATAIGTAVGALIGLIGGPPGAAVGAAIGASAGLTGDLVTRLFEHDFVDQVASDMRPGSTSVIVEAEEGDPRPIDEVVALRHGRVRRQDMTEAYAGQVFGREHR